MIKKKIETIVPALKAIFVLTNFNLHDKTYNSQNQSWVIH